MLFNKKVLVVFFWGVFLFFNFAKAEILIDQAPWVRQLAEVPNEQLVDKFVEEDIWNLKGIAYTTLYHGMSNLLETSCEATCAAMARRCIGETTIGNSDSDATSTFRAFGYVFICSEDQIEGLTGMTWTEDEELTPEDACGLIEQQKYSSYGLSPESNYAGIALCQECGCHGEAGFPSCDFDNNNEPDMEDDNSDGIDDDCGNQENPTGEGNSSGWGGFRCPVFPFSNNKDETSECKTRSVSISADPDKACYPFYNFASTVHWEVDGLFDKCIASGAWEGEKSKMGGSEEIIFSSPDMESAILTCEYKDKKDGDKIKYISSSVSPEKDDTTADYDSSLGFSPESFGPLTELPVKSTLSWGAHDDTLNCAFLDCFISGSDGFSTTSEGCNIYGSVEREFNKPGTYNYSMTCWNSMGANGCGPDESIVSITVPTVPPTVTLSASPNPVDGKAPLKTTATWNSNYANSCSLNFSPKTDVSGSDVVSREGGSGNKCALKEGLTASCTGDGGVGEASTTAEFKFKPDIKVNQKEITTNDGKKFVLYDWTAKNVTMCTVSEFSNGKWSDPSCSVGECRNDGGSGSLAQDSCVQVVCAGSGGAPVSTLIKNGSCTPKGTVIYCI